MLVRFKGMRRFANQIESGRILSRPLSLLLFDFDSNFPEFFGGSKHEREGFVLEDREPSIE